jgi:hypothetical protein
MRTNDLEHRRSGEVKVAETGRMPREISELSNPWEAEDSAGSLSGQASADDRQESDPEDGPRTPVRKTQVNADRVPAKRPARKRSPAKRATGVDTPVTGRDDARTVSGTSDEAVQTSAAASQANATAPQKKTRSKKTPVRKRSPARRSPKAKPAGGDAGDATTKKTPVRKRRSTATSSAASANATAGKAPANVEVMAENGVGSPSGDSVEAGADAQHASPIMSAVPDDNGQGLTATAFARSRSPAHEAEVMGGMWNSLSSAVRTAEKMGQTLSLASASQQGVRMATPAELWPGLIPRSSQQIHGEEPQGGKSETGLPPTQAEQQRPTPPDMTQHPTGIVPAEEGVEAISDTPAEPVPEPHVSHTPELPQTAVVEVVDEPQPSRPAAHASGPAEVVASTETYQQPAEEPAMAVDAIPDDDDEEQVLMDVATLPDGLVTGIEWLGLNSSADESGEVVLTRVQPTEDEQIPVEMSSAMPTDEPLQARPHPAADQGLYQAMEGLSDAVDDLHEELDVLATAAHEPDQTEVQCDMSEEDEFDADDHPEFASVLDSVEGTRTASVLARQMDAANASEQPQDQDATVVRREIPVESLFSGVASSLGSGLSSVAQSGKYAVMGVKYAAEDSNAVMRRMAGLFKRKKAEENDDNQNT